MTVLLRTHEAIDRLLDLLRCDHCNSTLHRPFTTGICEHLLCSNCRLGECAPKKSTGCPVCRVPVHPRDFQMHPQVAQLVLVARRLKKLMVDSGPVGLPQENSNKVDRPKETLQETDLDAFTSPFKESLEAALKPTVDSVKDESFLEPRVVLKRAYSSISSIKSLPARSNRKRGNSVDPDFLVADSQSSASGCPGRDSGSVASEPANNVSVTHKPRLTRDRSSTSGSQSTVTRLPAYRTLGGTLTTQNARQRQHFPSALSVGPSSDQNSEVRHTPPHGVNSDSMEIVLRAATHVHQTRGSLRRGACLDVTTHLSSENVKPPKVALSISPETIHGNFKTESRESFVRQSSRLHSNKKRHAADNTSADCKSTRLKPSSSFLRFVQKLRPNSKGESVLHRAAIRGNLDQVKSLLASGLFPNVRDHAGWMPLHEAVLYGHRDVAEALLKAGATVDAPGGPDLDTPLHDAIQNAQAACCELLLTHGANPVLPNAMGMTPLQLIDSQLDRLALPNPKSKRHLPCVDPKNATIVKQLHNVRIALLKAISQPRTSAETNKREVNTHNLVPDLISLVKTVNQTTFIERRRLRPVLLATGLSRPQQATFARVATMIHAQIATNISPDVTHVITGASQEIFGMDHSGQMSLVRTSSKPRGRVNTNPSTGAYQANCPRTLKFLNAVLQVGLIGVVHVYLLRVVLCV
ncbi:BRCA1-associated RING domain protein 1 [Paragonimus heterotremus]|uniref:BRCA1-associated RING domain protein 1 n=1 Tax=Paragonimus heterotremus TaxID=100268 RepID=A0A8J4T6U2_9TREM|nr:BRCA1-associated RING domain protein 1 [Paragonimus heterotremus]